PRAVPGVILRDRRRADGVPRPVVEGADPREEADRRGDEGTDQDDHLPEPDRMPAAPPAAEHNDSGADAEEERRHPRSAQEARIEEATPAGRRPARAVLDLHA